MAPASNAAVEPWINYTAITQALKQGSGEAYTPYTPPLVHHASPVLTTTVPLRSFSQEEFFITISAVVAYSHVCCAMILKEVKSTPLTSPSPHLLLYLLLFFFFFFKFWCSSRSSPAKSCLLLTFLLLPSLHVSCWISGSNIWRPWNRYGLSVIGLPRVIHFCNLGDGLMWRLHPCPYYDSVSVCGEQRLVRGGIDWSFTRSALFALPSISLSFFIHLFFPCSSCSPDSLAII